MTVAVRSHTTHLIETLPAQITFVWFVASVMHVHVILQVRQLGKRFLAHCTLERPVGIVHIRMDLQTGHLMETCGKSSETHSLLGRWWWRRRRYLCGRSDICMVYRQAVAVIAVNVAAEPEAAVVLAAVVIGVIEAIAVDGPVVAAAAAGFDVAAAAAK